MIRLADPKLFSLYLSGEPSSSPLYIPKKPELSRLFGFDIKTLSKPPKSIIAIDPGSVFVGAAISEECNSLATPLRAWGTRGIEIKNNEKEINKMVAWINYCVRRRNVGGLVFGCQGKDYDSDPTKKQACLRDLIDILNNHKSLSKDLVYTFQDETNTTEEAKLILGALGQKKKKPVLDIIAATLILERHYEEAHWGRILKFREHVEEALAAYEKILEGSSD